MPAEKKANKLVTLYLALYNLVNMAGWAYVLYLIAIALVSKLSVAQAWQTFEKPLLIVQSLAALEIVHSAIGFVSSPIASTFLQVFSRYAVLWGFTYRFADTGNSASPVAHWGLLLMAGSWSLVEVPRYAFYAVNLYGFSPYPLFWLRYSLFAILYPSGISGEILQIVQCLPLMLQRGQICSWYVTLLLLFSYLPGSPYMFFHMVSQRKKQMLARAGKGAAPAAAAASEGVDFPIDEATGNRSTTIVNQGAVVASLAAAAGEAGKEASQRAAAEKNWRYGYAKHFVKNVELSCASSEQCIRMAEAGLKYIHDNFAFAQKDDMIGTKALTVLEAMDKFRDAGGLEDGFLIKGEGKRKNKEYVVPYQKFLQPASSTVELTGGALVAQLDEWVKAGTIEKDARDAVANMVTQPDFHGDALKNRWFVLLGAGSAMGPLRVLLELGANVIALDIKVPAVWKRLVGMARASSGQMLIPISCKASEIKNDDDLCNKAGADLLKQTPQIAKWIAAQYPKSQLVIGGYAYLDSALFVRLAVAMDAIQARVMQERKDTAIAFLCSPTDVFVCDKECHAAMQKQRKSVPLWQSLLKLVVPKNMLVNNAFAPAKTDAGEEVHIVDGLAVAQGPNYALAKRLQHWRCMVAREKGHIVSTNVAPSTATQSVVHNPQFAAAYVGMGHFAPLEIVYQDLSNSVMTALLLNDICNPMSAAQPKTKLGPDGNQIRIFARTSMHFGIWRSAFKVGSIGEVSALIGYLKIYQMYIALALAATVAFAGVIVQKGAPHKWAQQ